MNYKEKTIKTLILHIFIILLIYPILSEISLFKQYNVYIKTLYLIVSSITICFCIYCICKTNLDKIYIYFAFISYIILLIVTLFVRNRLKEKLIETPSYLLKWLDIIFTNKIVFTNLLGNILLFIPLGIFIRFINCKLIYILIFIIIFIVNLELIQYIYKTGVFDIIDIILNIIGVFIGICLINKRGYQNG